MMPQYIYIGLVVLSLTIEAYRHGKPKSGTHDLRDQIIAVAISQSLLILGGFYSGLI